MLRIFAFILNITFATVSFASEKAPEVEWLKGDKPIEIKDAGAAYTPADGQVVAIGDDASKYLTFATGVPSEADGIAMQLNSAMDVDNSMIFSFDNAGFVKMDDWETTVNPDELLENIKKANDEANKIRKEGRPKVYVDSWVEKPTIDKDKAIVYWALATHNENGGNAINAKAISFGRKGYTEVQWVGAPDKFVSARDSFSPYLDRFKYNEGHKYTDYVPGVDKVAAFGAGALAVKLLAGGGSSKVLAGALGLLAVFLKKAWIVIFLPFLWFRNKFKKKKETKTD